MSKEKELKEQNEISIGSSMTEAGAVKEPTAAHVTHETHEIPGSTGTYESHITNGTPNGMEIKITQNNYSTPSYSHEESCRVIEEIGPAMISYLAKKLTSLPRKKLEKLAALVKQSSGSIDQKWDIVDYLLAAFKIRMDKWEYMFLKIEFEGEQVVESVEFKLTEILSAARSMSKENFDKLTRSIMACPAFKTDAEKVNLVEILKKIRSMTEKEFEGFKGMVKDSSITLTIANIEELFKTYTQLRQLTLEQIDEVFKMLKDLSGTL